MANSTHYNLLILGAGMSGLSAAQFVVQNQFPGFKFKVVEAQDRYVIF